MPHPGSLIPSSADPPRNYPGLRLWLRADLGVTLSGSKVAALADQSGNGANAVQAVGAAQPVWSATSGPNSTAGMTFAGAQSITSAAFDPAGAQQLDIFAVLIPNNPTNGIPWQTLDAGQAGCVLSFVQLGAGVQWIRIEGDGPGQTNAINTPVGSVVAGAAHIFEAKHDHTVPAPQTACLIDGVLPAQTVITADNVVGAFATQPMVLGNSTAIPIPYVGVISEFIVYNRLLNALERSNINRYLGTRYKITVP